MRVRSLLLLFLVVITVAFVVLNWFEFTRTARLNLLVGTIEAPLGLVMLVILTLFTSMFLAFVIYIQTSAFMDARRYAREMLSNKERLEKAENSRLAELRTSVESLLQQHGEQMQASQDIAIARLDKLEERLHTLVEQSGNSVAASIGELEDRFDRASQLMLRHEPSEVTPLPEAEIVQAEAEPEKT